MMSQQQSQPKYYAYISPVKELNILSNITAPTKYETSDGIALSINETMFGINDNNDLYNEIKMIKNNLHNNATDDIPDYNNNNFRPNMQHNILTLVKFTDINNIIKYNADNADNADNTDNADNAYNADNADNADNINYDLVATDIIPSTNMHANRYNSDNSVKVSLLFSGTHAIRQCNTINSTSFSYSSNYIMKETLTISLTELLEKLLSIAFDNINLNKDEFEKHINPIICDMIYANAYAYKLYRLANNQTNDDAHIIPGTTDKYNTQIYLLCNILNDIYPSHMSSTAHYFQRSSSEKILCF